MSVVHLNLLRLEIVANRHANGITDARLFVTQHIRAGRRFMTGVWAVVPAVFSTGFGTGGATGKTAGAQANSHGQCDGLHSFDFR